MSQKTRDIFFKNFKYFYLIFERIINSPFIKVAEMVITECFPDIQSDLEQSINTSPQILEHIQSAK